MNFSMNRTQNIKEGTTLKKLVIVFLIFTLIMPAVVSAADYTPALGMTMQEFVQKYNAVQAPLGAPYIQLNEYFADDWSYSNGYRCAWVYPETTKKAALIMMTKDPNNGMIFTSGLDMIQLYIAPNEDFIPLISLAIRCASIFSEDILTISTASFCVADVIKYYYESNAKEKNYSAYKQLNAGSPYIISFCYSNGYYFQISFDDSIK